MWKYFDAAELPLRGRDRRGCAPKSTTGAIRATPRWRSRRRSPRASTAAARPTRRRPTSNLRARGGMPDEIAERERSTARRSASARCSSRPASRRRRARRCAWSTAAASASTAQSVSDRGLKLDGRHLRRAGRQAQVRPRDPALRVRCKSRRCCVCRSPTAVVTIMLKTAAWWITGSVGLLSDAMESLVNLVSAAVRAGDGDDCRAAGRRGPSRSATPRPSTSRAPSRA